jgi:hypothetical protein
MVKQIFFISDVMELIKYTLDKDPWKRMTAYVDLKDLVTY